MKPGSVIVDMAAEQGGNCELTEPGKVVVKHGVTIIGYTDLPSRLAKQSSTLYATNLFRLAEELCKTKDGVINVNMDDEVIRGTTVIKEGNVTWPPPAPKLSAAPPAAAAKPAAAAVPAAKKGHGHGAGAPMAARTLAIMFGVAALLFWFIGAYAPAAFLGHFTVFVLACFVGYMVVWNVTPALHTPLMSVTNAISSIIAIGALVQIAPPLGAAGAAGRTTGYAGSRWRASRSPPSTCSAASPSPSACWRCSANKGDDNMSASLATVSYIGATILFHPEPRRPLQSGDLAPRQPLRHDRHDHRRAGDGVRAARHGGRHSVDHRRDGGRRQHRPLRRRAPCR